MTRRYYNETDPPEQPNTILQDRIQPMRDYFASLPPDGYDCSTCNNLADVFDLYPELFVDNTHRLAVRDIWIADGYMLDQ